ncbi:MYOSIN-11 [Salix viminalis]|uniref:MYOSIN-11 n=1 Tax=Salix viminalis TaxID=40686 RepID=A0A9Q0QHS2_SALVM|nr:MYOSIN-11 [Salix viminalis]
MHDSSVLSMRTNLGWKDDGVEAVTVQPKPSKQVLDHLVHSTDPSIIPLSSSISAARPRSKGEIQRELLGLKRKALSLRCNGETEKAEELLKMAKVLESQIDDLEGPKKELFAEASEDKKYQSSGSLNNHEKLNNVNNAVEMIEKLAAAAAAAVDPNEKVIESFTGSGRKGSDKTAPPSWSPDIVNQVPFEINEDNHPYVGDFDLLGEMGSLILKYQPENFTDKVDFGSDISCLLEPHVHVGSLRSGLENLRSKDREASSISDVSHFPDHHVHMVSMIHAPKDLGSTENVRTGKREETVNSGKSHVDETDSSQGLASQNSKNALQQEVLASKRKAVALKREGKLAEAREELLQAKQLEKSLEAETLEPESLSHKHLALKLRREGQVEEAEAEFELAKALEAHLDEMSSNDSGKSSVNIAEPVDVVVEDLLDPRLLSALKASGIENTSIISQSSERPGPAKVSATKSENNSQERTQFEERIKAVNLKRAGKQAEALDALRRAKLYEKKLNSL